ncbi:Tyrosine--tRNA ligase [Spatholobus suberectus]|nr:Tyrosine--tRNA ligase [Spatholobus suberectus]
MLQQDHSSLPTQPKASSVPSKPLLPHLLPSLFNAPKEPPAPSNNLAATLSKFSKNAAWLSPSPATRSAARRPHRSRSTAASTLPRSPCTWATSSVSSFSPGSAAMATAHVGDPSGKSLERPELDAEALEKNTLGISNTIEQILGRLQNSNLVVGSSSVWILNNYDWWKEFNLLDFLKRVGKYARVGSMIAKESVRKRLESEQGMSYTKFTYQLLQGYDFLHLFQNEGVSVQTGGSDQWGNITAGTELIRKILQVESAYGLTFPLLLKSDGTKFGKSVSKFFVSL